MYLHLKRFADIFISLWGILLLWPLMLITAVLIKLESKGPAIFKQQRLGKGGKVFEIYKFRSMCQGAEHTGSGVYSSKGDARVTKVGKIIRATSIDELPQLFNILKGDMSLIGPRPPLTYHPWPIEEYTEAQLHMFDTRPGITGWAQVNGRNDLTWSEKIEYDIEYIENYSWWFDIKILFGTVAVVLKQDGIAFTKEDAITAKEPVKEEVKEETITQ